MEDYIQEFECLTAQIPRLPDKQYIGYFLHGLKDGIRGRVRSFVAMGPITRSKLLHVTRAVEREIRGGSGWTRNPKIGRSNRVNPGRQGGTNWVLSKGARTVEIIMGLGLEVLMAQLVNPNMVPQIRGMRCT